MIQELEVLGRWWRYERYQIVGEVICPAPSSELREINPWEYHRKTELERSTTRSPYAELFDVAAKIQFIPTMEPFGPTRKATDESKKLILHWCNRFGLLGLLPATTAQVRLAPRFDYPPSSNEQEPSQSQGPLWIQQKTFTEYYGGWKARTSSSPAGCSVDLQQRGELVPSEMIPSNWPAAVVLTRTLDDGEYVEKALSDYYSWKQFFPSVPAHQADRFSYPRPFTNEFWKQYGEPVWDFVWMAQKLARAIEILSAIQAEQEWTEAQKMEAADAYRFMSSLVAGVRPRFHFNLKSGVVSQYWVCTSLLASLGMMAMMDMCRGRRLLLCKTCKKPFVSSSREAQFCSPRCRGTMQMRRQRAKKKSARSPGEEG